MRKGRRTKFAAKGRGQSTKFGSSVSSVKFPHARPNAKADDFGSGAHIPKLLELARVSGKSRSEIISDWNSWVATESRKGKRFQLDLSSFNSNADVWKTTPLWGKDWSGHRDRLLLDGIDLRGADLWGAHFEDAQLWDARFDSAMLWAANFQKAILWGASIRGAILNWSDFSHADVTGIRYQKYSGLTWLPFWPFRFNLMLGRYLGIRGVDSCYGHPSFRRDASDQDYIDDKYNNSLFLIKMGLKWSIRSVKDRRIKSFNWIVNFPPVKLLRAIRWSELATRVPRRVAFWMWALSDYGRSVTSIVLLAFLMIGLFGIGYAHGVQRDIVFIHDGPMIHNPIYPWFVSSMGFATLGISDLVEPQNLVGVLLMVGNVLSGFITLGSLLSVLGNSFARRA